MQHVLTSTKISNTISAGMLRSSAQTHKNVFTTFFAWCNAQESSRLLWMAAAFGGLILFALPCTALPMLLLGKNYMALWILTCAVNVPVVALSLAAQPTKIIIPALFISWIVDAGIILTTLITFFTKL
jgi:hypothetical protein